MSALRAGLSWAKYPLLIGLVLSLVAVFRGDGIAAAKGVLFGILLGIPVFVIGAILGYLRK